MSRTQSQDAYAAALAAAMGFLSCPTDTSAARKWITDVEDHLRRQYGYWRIPREQFAAVLEALESSGFLTHMRECRDGLVTEHWTRVPPDSEQMLDDLAAEDPDPVIA